MSSTPRPRGPSARPGRPTRASTQARTRPSAVEMPPNDPDYMLSLARGLAVIRAFGDQREGVSVGAVALATGMSRAATRRCLVTLTMLGYAEPQGGGFALTPAVLSLGYAHLGSQSLVRVAQPILERVSATLHESTSLAIRDGDEIVYVVRAATRRILSISLSVGSRLPVACTSMGRVLVAFDSHAAREEFLQRVDLVRFTPKTVVDRERLGRKIDQVRTRGYAIVDQEFEIGLRSLAVPVLRPDGTVVAAINVGVHVGRADADALVRDFLPVLREAAAEIGAAFRHTIA